MVGFGYDDRSDSVAVDMWVVLVGAPGSNGLLLSVVPGCGLWAVWSGWMCTAVRSRLPVPAGGRCMFGWVWLWLW